MNKTRVIAIRGRKAARSLGIRDPVFAALRRISGKQLVSRFDKCVPMPELTFDAVKNWTTKDFRRVLEYCARDQPLKTVLQLAVRCLDETNLWTLIRNLGRPNNGTKERRNRHFIDWFFIFHWNRGFRKTGDEVWNQFPPLCRWPTPALSALASLVLHEIGIPYILSPGACRKGFNDCGKWAQSLMLRNRS